MNSARPFFIGRAPGTRCARMGNASAENLLSLAEASIILGVSPFTLRTWLAKGSGPPHLRVGRLIKIRRASLEAWLKTCAVGSTASGDAA